MPRNHPEPADRPTPRNYPESAENRKDSMDNYHTYQEFLNDLIYWGRKAGEQQPDFHPAALHSRSKKQIYLLLCFPAELHSLDIKPDLISDTGYVFAVGRSALTAFRAISE